MTTAPVIPRSPVIMPDGTVNPDWAAYFQKIAAQAYSTPAQVTDQTITVTDNTVNNASVTAHGWMPKLDGNSSHYLSGAGGFSSFPIGTIQQENPADPATINTPAVSMMGLAGSFTPAKSGNVLVIVSGTMTMSGSADNASAQIYYGTDAAPANGDAATGTAVGGIASLLSGDNNWETPMCLAVALPGLTVGRTYWIDVGMSKSGGTTLVRAGLQTVSISVIEQ